jgi:hypothetical protein
MNLIEAAAALQKFGGNDLTRTLANVEIAVQGMLSQNCADALATFGVNDELLLAAGLMKRVAGQVNVVIHAMGILACLPHLLEPGESVKYVSLGAGNTGRSFDLETSHRVAEFKFIRWQGGPESIRQNQLFKDFYLLARSDVNKSKNLYVLGTYYPLRFFNGRRALSSVLSPHTRVAEQFNSDFGDRYGVVRDYYLEHKDKVKIEDVSQYVPDLIANEIAEMPQRGRSGLNPVDSGWRFPRAPSPAARLQDGRIDYRRDAAPPSRRSGRSSIGAGWLAASEPSGDCGGGDGYSPECHSHYPSPGRRSAAP